MAGVSHSNGKLYSPSCLQKDRLIDGWPLATRLSAGHFHGHEDPKAHRHPVGQAEPPEAGPDQGPAAAEGPDRKGAGHRAAHRPWCVHARVCACVCLCPCQESDFSMNQGASLCPWPSAAQCLQTSFP